MTLPGYGSRSEAIAAAQARGRLCHIITPENQSTEFVTTLITLLGHQAVDIDFSIKPAIEGRYWILHEDCVWAYQGGNKYVFDNEDDAVLVTLACS
jgi:hypothetical protein